MFLVHLIDTHLLINDSRRLYFLLWKEEIYFNGSPNILKYLDRGGGGIGVHSLYMGVQFSRDSNNTAINE